MHEVELFDISKYICSESLFSTLYIEVEHKYGITLHKNALFFLSRAPTHHSFTFNSQFLYGLKHKVHPSKSACGIFHFRFCLVFIKVYIFVQQKTWTL